MPYNTRLVRDYTRSGVGGILRKENGASNVAAFGAERKQIDLLVFGYACKVFRDDDKAGAIDQGKHLIPWMGDISLKIDRYDVRGALCDLTPHEAPSGGYGNRLDYLTPEEQRAEQLCEEERYFCLYNNEEQHKLDQEEELKRFREESDNAECYKRVGMEYDSAVSRTDGEIHGPKREEFFSSPSCEESEQIFVLPKNFVVPQSISLPETMKEHAIIEKTAHFIATQGTQMEILLKAKQSTNLQFDFLTQGSVLNPYYKHVLSAIKDGTYSVQEAPKEPNNNDRSKDQDNLVESFSVADRPVIAVPTIKYKPSASCAYTQLISKIKGVPLPEVIIEHTYAVNAVTDTAANTNDKPTVSAEVGNSTSVLPQCNGHAYITASESTTSEIKPSGNYIITNATPEVEILKNSSAFLLAQNYSSDSETDNEVPPPPKLHFPVPTESLQNIIDKTASYVIKNGRQFEETLRAKSEERFTFLLPDNEFYPYYMYKITGDPDAASIEQKTRKAAAVAAALMSQKTLPKHSGGAHVSFSIKCNKEDQLQPALPQEVSDEDEEKHMLDKRVSHTGTDVRTVPEHVKRAIQLVENQLMARNAQLAAVVGAAAATPPCNVPTMVRSRFDLDYSSQPATKPAIITAITNAEMERNAIYEQQQQNRHKELKRAEEKVKDKLAQIAREKLGGLISKEKQLQLERKRKALAFLHQIKGSSERETTLDVKPALEDGNVSDNSDNSVHSIPITSYGPDDKTEDEEEQRLSPPTPSMRRILKKKLSLASSSAVDSDRIVELTADDTLSEEDDVQIISDTKAQFPHLAVYKCSHSKVIGQGCTRSRSRSSSSSRSKNMYITRNPSLETLKITLNATKKRTHKSAKRKKSSTRPHSKKSKSKKPTRSRSRYSRSASRLCSHNRHSSRSPSTYRTGHLRRSPSTSHEGGASSPSKTTKRRHHHHNETRRKHSPTPTRHVKRRRH